MSYKMGEGGRVENGQVRTFSTTTQKFLPSSSFLKPPSSISFEIDGLSKAEKDKDFFACSSLLTRTRGQAKRK